MTLTIAIANQKGGVGKTTTAVHIAHYLAQAGKLVLLIDLDPQGQVAIALGARPSDGLYQAIIGKRPVNSLVWSARPNLCVLCGGGSTSILRQAVRAMYSRELTLYRLLQTIHGYDVIIFDCAPSLDILSINALIAADQLLIPVDMSALGLEGLSAQINTLSTLDKEYEGPADVASLGWVLPTMYESVTTESKRVLAELNTYFSGLLLHPIRKRTLVRELAAKGETLFDTCTPCDARDDYATVGATILNHWRKEQERCEKREGKFSSPPWSGPF